MKEQSYRSVTRRWCARFLSMLAFAVIAGSFPLNALAIHNNPTAGSGGLLFPDGSFISCQLTVANSQIVADLPNATVQIQQVDGQTIVCSHFTAPNTNVSNGTATLVQADGVTPGTIKATGFAAGSCSSNNQAGTSEQPFTSKCGSGNDVTFFLKITFTSGPLVSQTLYFSGGGVNLLAGNACNTFLPQVLDNNGQLIFGRGEIVRTGLEYDQTKCQGTAQDSLFNFRTCTANALQTAPPLSPPSCVTVTSDHVGSGALDQFKRVDAATRDSVNQSSCTSSNGVFKVILDGADVAASTAGFSSSTVDVDSFRCGNPDNLEAERPVSVTFGSASPFNGDTIPDATVTCSRCVNGVSIFSNGTATVIFDRIDGQHEVGVVGATLTSGQ